MHSSLFVPLFVPLLLAVASAQAAPRWTFGATLDPQAGELSLRTCSESAQLRVHFIAGVEGAARHRLTVRRDSDSALRIEGDAVIAHDWAVGECLHLRIDLAAAARAERQSVGDRGNEYLLLDPGRWLWRPEHIDPGSEIRFELPEGWNVSVPWPALDHHGRRYRLGSTSMHWPALSAFGRFELHDIARAGGRLRVALLPPWSARELPRIAAVSDALLQGYGRLPLAQTQVLVVPLPGQRRAAPWGQVTRGGASAVHLFVGADAGHDALIEDWTATHEFAHLLHPYLGNSGRWLGEGLASYYQNVLRARTGTLDADDAWGRIEAGFGRGRAERRSAGPSLAEASRRMRGLRAYMRVYWSGAAYWLESDLALRARGSSLDQILARYAECCLADAARVAPEDFAAALDRLAGDEVFGSRYRRFAALREFPDTHVPLPTDPRRAAIMRARAPASP